MRLGKMKSLRDSALPVDMSPLRRLDTWLPTYPAIQTPDGMSRVLTHSVKTDELRAFVEKKSCFVQMALPGCAPCREMKQALEIVFEEREDKDVLVFEMSTPSPDADKFIEEFKIGSFPTFLYFSEGKALRRWAGFFPDGDFASKVTRLAGIVDSCH